jgi:hypothetical protein
MYKHIYGFDCYDSEEEGVTEKNKSGGDKLSPMELRDEFEQEIDETEHEEVECEEVRVEEEEDISETEKEENGVDFERSKKTKSYGCDKCKKTYKYQASLASHKRSKHAEGSRKAKEKTNQMNKKNSDTGKTKAPVTLPEDREVKAMKETRKPVKLPPLSNIFGNIKMVPVEKSKFVTPFRELQNTEVGKADRLRLEQEGTSKSGEQKETNRASGDKGPGLNRRRQNEALK